MSQPAEQVIPPKAFDLYDEYCHGFIDRRTFMSRLSTLSGAGVSMSVMTAALLPDYALAEQVSFNDPDIVATYETFSSPGGHGEGRGYLVKPKALDGKGPAVLVVHENRGLNPYVKDVARRLAKQGFVAFAPDALHTLGGYPGNDDQGREMQGSLERGKIEQDFIAAARHLKSHAASNGKLGVVGFCFGGYVSNMLAATIPDVIDAAVPFYGTPARDDVVGNIRGPILINYAELDDRVNATWPAYEKVLQEKQVTYQAYVYPGTRHGFHNDSTGRYDNAAAELAWSRTLAFFKEHLG